MPHSSLLEKLIFIMQEEFSRMEKYKYLEHTADIMFQAFGRTVEEAFENSAIAMFNAMYDGKIKENIKKKIKVSGRDFENLLYNFLEEFLVLMDSEGFFMASCKVKIKKIKTYELEADITGDDAKDYAISLDVKAITYNNMFVKKEKDLWTCQVLIDV